MYHAKLINVVALLSGLTSLGLIGGGAYLYLNKDVLIEDARAKVTKAVTEAAVGCIRCSAWHAGLSNA